MNQLVVSVSRNICAMGFLGKGDSCLSYILTALMGVASAIGIHANCAITGKFVDISKYL